MRACLPDGAAGSKVKPATAVLLHEGAPDGRLLARVPLSVPSLSHANCGYLIGSYWAPGVMNDDPSAMAEVSVALEVEPAEAGAADSGGGGGGGGTATRDVYLSIEGGGHVAIDWFRFETP
jgi:hypothetical protein